MPKRGFDAQESTPQGGTARLPPQPFSKTLSSHFFLAVDRRLAQTISDRRRHPDPPAQPFHLLREPPVHTETPLTISDVDCSTGEEENKVFENDYNYEAIPLPAVER
jgi:hypothetical protein